MRTCRGNDQPRFGVALARSDRVMFQSPISQTQLLKTIQSKVLRAAMIDFIHLQQTNIVLDLQKVAKKNKFTKIIKSLC